MEHGSVRELASLSLNIQSKKFYLDVKENMSGRFVKIAEVAKNFSLLIIRSIKQSLLCSDQRVGYQE